MQVIVKENFPLYNMESGDVVYVLHRPAALHQVYEVKMITTHKDNKLRI